MNSLKLVNKFSRVGRGNFSSKIRVVEQFGLRNADLNQIKLNWPEQTSFWASIILARAESNATRVASLAVPRITPPPRLPSPEKRKCDGKLSIFPSQSIITISSSVQAGLAILEARWENFLHSKRAIQIICETYLSFYLWKITKFKIERKGPYHTLKHKYLFQEAVVKMRFNRGKNFMWLLSCPLECLLLYLTDH